MRLEPALTLPTGRRSAATRQHGTAVGSVSWVWADVLRVAPILVFLLSITVVAELADAAACSSRPRRSRAGGAALGAAALAAARGPRRRMHDPALAQPTAVLLACGPHCVARHLGLKPWPLRLRDRVASHTASLLLRCRTTTNLLLVDSSAGAWRPVRTDVATALVSIVVSVVLLWLWYAGRCAAAS